MIYFRSAGVEELYKIRQIAYQTWPDTFGAVLSEEQIGYMLNLIYSDESIMQQVNQGHEFILAEQDGDAVGFCSYEINYKASKYFMIHKLYILPSVQGLGIGTGFLNRLNEMARRHHDAALRLKVFHLNVRAINFYIKYGFRKMGAEISQFGNYNPVVDYVMIKAL